MKEVTEEFYQAAIELAKYIGDSDGERAGYAELRKEGFDN